jgi:hypothetical protein
VRSPGLACCVAGWLQQGGRTRSESVLDPCSMLARPVSIELIDLPISHLSHVAVKQHVPSKLRLRDLVSIQQLDSAFPSLSLHQPLDSLVRSESTSLGPTCSPCPSAPKPLGRYPTPLPAAPSPAGARVQLETTSAREPGSEETATARENSESSVRPRQHEPPPAADAQLLMRSTKRHVMR